MTLCAGCSRFLARTLGEQVRLDLRLDRAPCVVRADPSQLEQVVLNLLVNARDAMPNGGSAVITVAPLAPSAVPPDMGGGRWVLSLGCCRQWYRHADEATAERALEPFFTTKERGKGHGARTVNTVFSIVQAAGGQVRLQSKVDEGATLRVYLPFGEGPASRLSPSHGSQAVGGGESVLLVEDDDAVRRVTSRMLEGLGFRVIAAAGPRQALDLARDHIGTI